MMTLEQWNAWIREKPMIRTTALTMVKDSQRPAGIYAVRENHQSHIENVGG